MIDVVYSFCPPHSPKYCLSQSVQLPLLHNLYIPNRTHNCRLHTSCDCSQSFAQSRFHRQGKKLCQDFEIPFLNSTYKWYLSVRFVYSYHTSSLNIFHKNKIFDLRLTGKFLVNTFGTSGVKDSSHQGVYPWIYDAFLGFQAHRQISILNLIRCIIRSSQTTCSSYLMLYLKSYSWDESWCNQGRSDACSLAQSSLYPPVYG